MINRLFIDFTTKAARERTLVFTAAEVRAWVTLCPVLQTRD